MSGAAWGVGGGGEEVKALLQIANFTLGPDAILRVYKYSVRIKASNSVNATKQT